MGIPDPKDRIGGDEVAATEPAAAPAPKPPLHRRPLPYVALLVFAAAFAAAFVVLSGSEEAGAEVILEPTSAPGDDPFTDSVATESVELEGGGVDEVSGGSASVESVDGSAPGLYGGTGEAAVCDAAQMIAFLEENPDKASAFAEAVGVSAKELPDYISGLTPVLLREDTRVTNHGFMSGAANPFQAVLQAGTAVMVDDRGVPRVRCECGNPLAEPAAAEESPEFTGERWSSFDEGRLVAVSQSAEPIETFELTNVETGETYEQPAGSGGLTVDDLLNLKIPVEVCDVPAKRFRNGVHPDSGQPSGDGFSEITIEVAGIDGGIDASQSEPQAVVGDLTGDGIDDGAVTVTEFCGGAGTVFSSTYAFDSSGKLIGRVDWGVNEPGATFPDGATNLEIVDGGIEADVTGYAADDDHASPSLEEHVRIEVEGGELVPVE